MLQNKKTITIIGILLLVLFPIFFLIYKISSNPDSTDVVTNTANQPVDLSAIENAAKANPSFDNLINLSNAYVNNNMPAKSIEPLQKAIELNPNSAIAYCNIGVAYTMLQQYKKGIEACTKAIQLDSTFQLAKNNLKWAMDENNKLLSSVQAMEQTPEKDRNTVFYINYGLLHLKLENYDKSIEIWSKILETEPNNSAALNNIGTAYMQKLQYDNAIMCFKKAVEFDANDQLAKNNLVWALDEKNKSETLQNKK